MKTIRCLICIFLIALIFCGCNFKVSSSIDDLISPVSPIGDNADVKTALDEFAVNGYTLKTPAYGKYITSYTFFDIDNDKEDEAVAFYEPNDDLGTIKMAVIKKQDKKWQVVECIDGIGKDIYSLDFVDINGAQRKELITCWDVINNSTSHELCVYEVGIKENKINLIMIGESISVNNYIPVDINEDSLVELLVFKLGTGSTSYAAAELCSFKDGNLKTLGETKLDSHISGYSQLKTEIVDNDIRVYADAVSSSGSSMLTEIIYWSNSYGTIISPFYSYSSGRTKETSRNAMVPSADINSDSRIEIPTDYSLKSLPQGIYCINWKAYKNTAFVHTDYSLYSVNDRYNLIIPDNVIDKISVDYEQKNRILVVSNKKNKKEVFSIIPALKATYKKGDYKGYSVILDSQGYYFLAKIGDNSEIDITIDDLKNCIKTI